MPEVMLRPNWPNGKFSRTVVVAKGKKNESSRHVEFRDGVPVEVTDAELIALQPDLGLALYEIERDEKRRPRYVESVAREESNA